MMLFPNLGRLYKNSFLFSYWLLCSHNNPPAGQLNCLQTFNGSNIPTMQALSGQATGTAEQPWDACTLGWLCGSLGSHPR